MPRHGNPQNHIHLLYYTQIYFFNTPLTFFRLCFALILYYNFFKKTKNQIQFRASSEHSPIYQNKRGGRKKNRKRADNDEAKRNTNRRIRITESTQRITTVRLKAKYRVCVPETYTLEIITTAGKRHERDENTRLHLSYPLLRLFLLHEHNRVNPVPPARRFRSRFAARYPF